MSTSLVPDGPAAVTGPPLAQGGTSQLAIDCIRALAIDAVEAAKSGHPGAPLGLAPVAYALWTRFLRHDPAAPDWSDRDRLVLSCGHASMLLYAMLHLTGYRLSLDDLRCFRQLGSRTPGHPERGVTPGVEVTTGPLGQGISNAVGMAMAERFLARTFNRPGHDIVSHRTWVIASDGDLMEGVSAEAASLAGHLALEKLIVLYDDNRITIEGSTDLAFSEDVGARYAAYGWRVLRVSDGNHLPSIMTALEEAETPCGRPTLVVVRTHIGYPSPNKQDSAEAHGAPLGPDEARATKQAMCWPAEPTFLVPEVVRRHLGTVRDIGERRHREWSARVAAWETAHPELGAGFARVMAGELPDGWDAGLPTFSSLDGPLATRQASGKALQAIARAVPEVLGGSADLGPSNDTHLPGERDFTASDPGRIVHFGVREHAMGAVLNGMAAHGGVRPFGATFLVFADYMRPAIRLAALMELPVIYVFTHDSIGLGEDGPTHQPVEHLASLRAIPNLLVLRPADANETVEAWRVAMHHRDGPVALVLTRQKLPVLEAGGRVGGWAGGVAKGGYVLRDAEAPKAILIATGSEVSLAVEAADRLEDQGIPVRVVSLPSWELFRAQPAEYRDAVLLPSVRARLAIEAGSAQGWCRWITDDGDMISMDRFGASAPAPELFRRFGFTVDNVVTRVHALLSRRVA